MSLLHTLENSPNNLPVQPTPFLGREHEVTAIGDLLRREDVRLVTLTGPGGTGKTRLALPTGCATRHNQASRKMGRVIPTEETSHSELKRANPPCSRSWVTDRLAISSLHRQYSSDETYTSVSCFGLCSFPPAHFLKVGKHQVVTGGSDLPGRIGLFLLKPLGDGIDQQPSQQSRHKSFSKDESGHSLESSKVRESRDGLQIPVVRMTDAPLTEAQGI